MATGGGRRTNKTCPTAVSQDKMETDHAASNKGGQGLCWRQVRTAALAIGSTQTCLPQPFDSIYPFGLQCLPVTAQEQTELSMRGVVYTLAAVVLTFSFAAWPPPPSAAPSSRTRSAWPRQRCATRERSKAAGPPPRRRCRHRRRPLRRLPGPAARTDKAGRRKWKIIEVAVGENGKYGLFFSPDTQAFSLEFSHGPKGLPEVSCRVGVPVLRLQYSRQENNFEVSWRL